MELSKEWAYWNEEYAQHLKQFQENIQKERLMGANQVFSELQNLGIMGIRDLTYEIIEDIYHRNHKPEAGWRGRIINTVLCELITLMSSNKAIPIGYSLLIDMLRTTTRIRLWYRMSNEEFRKISNVQKSESPKLSISDIINFINEIEKKMTDYQYTKIARQESRHILHALCIFLEMNHLDYSSEIGEYWLTHWKESVCLRRFNLMRHTLAFLNDRSHDQPMNLLIHRMKDPRKLQRLPAWCKAVACRYICTKKAMGYRPSTIDMLESSITRFLFYVSQHHIDNFQNLSIGIIRQFNLEDRHKTIEGKNAYNYRIRDFLSYLAENKLTTSRLDYALSTSKTYGGCRIVETFNENQQGEIKTRIKNHSLSYRDIAIIELGIHMGFRRIDIVNLKIEDINWHSGMIKCIQQKTQYEIQIAMPTSVENAIYQYIVNERPQCSDHHVFLSTNAPYRPLNPSVCNGCMMRALPGRKSRGFHITRKTFASSCLNHGASTEEVQELLGHQDLSNLHKYLSLDEHRMRECALSLSEFNICPKEASALWIHKQ